jgi:integrase
MIKRRAKAAALPYSICCHTFRATGITTYLENGRNLHPRGPDGNCACARKAGSSTSYPMPSCAGRDAARLHRCRRHRRGAQGLAVSHIQEMKWGVLSEDPMNQADAWRIVRRGAAAAGIKAPIGCHTFRATGSTAYLENGGTLEHAQAMSAREVPASLSSMTGP